MIMTEVLYICLWYKDKKRTWSGTAWSLRQAMEPYLQVQDLALSDPLYRKILRRLQRKKGLPPGPILRDRLRLSGRYAAWRHRHRTDEKMPVFQFGGWPSGAHLASYLY